MIQIDDSYIVQITTGIVGFLTAVAISIQTWLRHTKDAGSEHSLIKMMHEELERMSKQNAILSDEIGNLQTELIRLNSHLVTLSSENQKLQLEVANLNSEIARLHGIMSSKKEGGYGDSS